MKCFKDILNIHHRQIPFIQDTTSDRKYQNTEKNKSSLVNSCLFLSYIAYTIAFAEYPHG